MTDELTTGAEITWCPGCGNFGILNAVKRAVKALGDRGIGKDRLFITACIGCHAKIFDYLALSGVYALHGRSMAVAQGAKLANPDLRVISFTGDGAGYGEGIAHMIFAAKRNADITVIVHDNGVYALTTGQRSPTSEAGFAGPSTPHGNEEDPLNPLALLLEAGATFVARGYSARIDSLADIIVAAVEHRGFSLVEVLQPSVVFHDTYEEYNASVDQVSEPASTLDAALALARRTDRLPTGILYRVDRKPHDVRLYGDWNPVRNHPGREARIKQVEALR
ncbi:MAG: 2-oxoacid:ferredoxin oxidoreductase subunit beta [Candidatus Eisenbacteria bacterium]|nr:2-oxoacid:ferredoxin oxidoreductase subunit beta [Candidatus Eisenbacteria bacterium]